MPALQVAPSADGQTVNLAEPRCAAEATLARTETPELAAFVVHTQITKLALPPGLTWDEDEKDWTRTHRSGVFFVGGVGEVLGVGVGVGLGVGLGELEEGDGLGDGSDALGFADALPDGDAAAELPDGLGLTDGLSAAELPGDGVVLGVADFVLGVADFVLAADLRPGRFTDIAVSTTAFLGIEEHAVLTLV